MNKYSVWYMPYNKKYLLTHPWKWFSCAWRNIRDAWHRSVYGWAYGDVWDWDNWFLHTVPDMLRYMADHGSAFPGHTPFDTPEKWHEWLHEMADLLETGSEDWQDEHNEFYEEYLHQNRWTPTFKEKDGKLFHAPQLRTEIDKKYIARATQLAKQGEDNVRRAFALLGEHFYNLYD